VSEVVIELAKAAIFVALGLDSSFDLSKALNSHPALNQNGATFVTLTTKTDGRLRGCIGSLEAYQPLYKDIISNAQSSALRDSRFAPLTLSELDNINIEVSILSKPQEISYKSINDLKSKIAPNKDGIILIYDNYKATYLPQVWKQLPYFDLFFDSLCQKAGLDRNCLSKHPEIKSYRVTKYKEPHDDIN
jgi:AmmeMemoRadiSam system protein A